jgi:general secretion pathway protein G
MALYHAKRKKAFTLIELLIVVAIIGILAAIAVPNFLAAQIRAKVARTEADLHTLCIAVESYMADYGVYPPTRNSYPNGIPASGVYCGWRLLVCTTPVPYISTLYFDPFAEDPKGPVVNPTWPTPYCWRNVMEYLSGDVVLRNADIGQQTVWVNTTGLYPEYVFWGYGPDQDCQYGFRDPTYDPTNGIISNGDIYLLGPGTIYANKPPT